MDTEIKQAKAPTHSVNAALLRAMMAQLFGKQVTNLYYLYALRHDYPPESYPTLRKLIEQNKSLMRDLNGFESTVTYDLVTLDDERHPIAKGFVLIKVSGVKKRQMTIGKYPLYMAEPAENPGEQFIIPSKGFDPITLERLDS